MSRRVFIGTVVVALALGIALGYIRGVPDDFAQMPDPDSFDYGYRCGDGSEFTVEPSEDMQSLTIVPATSVDYLKKTVLYTVDGGAYNGGGITFAPHGTTADLSTASSAPTTCTSMNAEADTLFK